MTMQHERMGYRSTDRLLIVNADDYGMCRTYNSTIQGLLQDGVISSTSLMVPCPWAKDAADFSKKHPEFDVGIHLTFTSEWADYRWGPVTRDQDVSSLRTADGWLHADCTTFEKHADLKQVRIEIFNQIERAITWGVNPTHLDIHMYSLLGLASGRDFLEPVFDACVNFGLPLRLPRSWGTRLGFTEAQAGLMQRRIQEAEARHIALIDDQQGLDFGLRDGETYADTVEEMSAQLRALKPGISEILLHAGDASEELRSIMPHDFRKRDMEAHLFLDDRIRQLLAKENLQLLRWRMLRDYQRGIL